jgi:hypothetical protein
MCSDSDCHPDLGVKQLEQIAWHLQQLSPDEQEKFRDFAERTAADEHRAGIAEQVRTLVNGLLPA